MSMLINGVPIWHGIRRYRHRNRFGAMGNHNPELYLHSYMIKILKRKAKSKNLPSLLALRKVREFYSMETQTSFSNLKQKIKN
jgi:hypothetical protein